ncbi:MAG: acyl carrier protein [Clostridiaceae bacterium]
MNKNEIILKLKKIIIKCLELNIEPDNIQGTNLIEELGINSVDAMEILVWVENNFEIEIDDEDLNADLIKSLDSLSDYILNKKK